MIRIANGNLHWKNIMPFLKKRDEVNFTTGKTIEDAWQGARCYFAEYFEEKECDTIFKTPEKRDRFILIEEHKKKGEKLEHDYFYPLTKPEWHQKKCEPVVTIYCII